MSENQTRPSRLLTWHRSDAGYGWSVTFGKRVQWSSRKATSRMWPKVILGADEVCNRAVTFVLWPLGHLDVWWEPTWRTRNCDDCRAEHRARNACEDCGCRPCCCTESADENDQEQRAMSTRPYRTVTVTLKEGDVLNLGPHDQAFYKGTEHRNQYGIWHQFVLLVLDENDPSRRSS